VPTPLFAAFIPAACAFDDQFSLEFGQPRSMPKHARLSADKWSKEWSKEFRR
jgi:hypothetical protein